MINLTNHPGGYNGKFATRWTEEEDAIIREHYPSGGYKACMPLLARQVDKKTVQSRALRIGVFVEDPKHSFAGEVERLLRSRKKISAQQIASELNCTPQTVYRIMKTLPHLVPKAFVSRSPIDPRPIALAVIERLSRVPMVQLVMEKIRRGYRVIILRNTMTSRSTIGCYSPGATVADIMEDIKHHVKGPTP